MEQHASLLLTTGNDSPTFLEMEKESYDGEKGSIRAFKEVETISKQTERETNVDSHIVTLAVMRFFRQLPPKVRLAIVTRDPGTYSDLLVEGMSEIAEAATKGHQASDSADRPAGRGGKPKGGIR